MISALLLEKIGKVFFSQVENELQDFAEDKNLQYMEFLLSKGQRDK